MWVQEYAEHAVAKARFIPPDNDDVPGSASVRPDVDQPGGAWVGGDVPEDTGGDPASALGSTSSVAGQTTAGHEYFCGVAEIHTSTC